MALAWYFIYWLIPFGSFHPHLTLNRGGPAPKHSHAMQTKGPSKCQTIWGWHIQTNTKLQRELNSLNQIISPITDLMCNPNYSEGQAHNPWRMLLFFFSFFTRKAYKLYKKYFILSSLLIALYTAWTWKNTTNLHVRVAFLLWEGLQRGPQPHLTINFPSLISQV